MVPQLLGFFRNHRILMTRLLFAICLLFVGIHILWSITHYLNDTYENQAAIANKELYRITERNCAIVKSEFKNYVKTLQTIAEAIEKDGNVEAFSREKLSVYAKAAGYKSLAICYSDGSVISTSGENNYPIQPELTSLFSSGETYITDVEQSGISVYAPINDAGTIGAFLRLQFSVEHLDSMFSGKLYEGLTYYHVIDSNGKYIALSDNPNKLLAEMNLYDAALLLQFEKGHTSDAFLATVKAGESGYTRYSYDNQRRYAYYAPVGINGWLILTVMPEAFITEQSSINTRFAISLVLRICFMLLFIFAYAFLQQRRVGRKSSLNEKCLRILAEQTGKVIFEWDFDRDKITSLTNFEKLFGRQAVTVNSGKEALDAQMVHNDDKEAFIKVFADIRKGLNVDDARFRVKDSRGVYHHCTLSGVIIKDDKNRLYKAIGSLENIDEQVKEEEALRQKAATDQLTGLLNKAASEKIITEILASAIPGRTHALICSDLDYFKNINDSFGHLYGDMVLKEIAEEFKTLFRSSDIIGRFGGDEFIALILDIPDKNFIKSKIIDLNNRTRKTYTENGISHTVSMSIGVAFYPADGADYSKLYRRADEASYHAKRTGRDRFVFADTVE